MLPRRDGEMTLIHQWLPDLVRLGPAVELPAALEDLAVVQAESGREEDARTALNEAVSLYEGLRAH
jgi:hypothetical protein